MKEFKEKYISYIDKNLAELNRLIETYKADNRKDEANLEKVKANIYEVFRIIFLSDLKQLEEKNIVDANNQSIYEGLLKRFDTIQATWRISLDKATEHGDITRQVIEENKLAVAEKLKSEFLSLIN